MSKESKTGKKAAQAAAAMAAKDKKVITDEQYIKNLRADLEQGLYVAQEGARALLREYDKLLAYTRETEQKLLDVSSAYDATVLAHDEVVKSHNELVAEVNRLDAEIKDRDARIINLATQIGTLLAEKEQQAKIAKDAPFADQVAPVVDWDSDTGNGFNERGYEAGQGIYHDPMG